MSRKFLMIAAALVAIVFPQHAQAGRAGAQRTARQSARTMSRSHTMGHHVAISNGLYEGVSVSSSRAVSRNSTCYANDASKSRVASKTICRGGRCYTSNMFAPK